jgi:hypothetical protein
VIKLSKIISEKFYDIAQSVGKDKGDWIDLEKPKIKPKIKSDLPTRENLFDLVNNAYMTALGTPHVGIKTPNDVLGDEYDYWEAIDMDENPDADAVLFGKKKYGIKISGIGHNGEKLSKQTLLRYQINLLHKNRYWIEASAPVSDIMLSKGAPVFSDKEKIQKMFQNSEFTNWFEDGSYIRTIPNSGRSSEKKHYIFGNPKI